MGLFGMTQYIGHVGGDVFLNFALSGAIQVPGNFLAWWTMNSLGRRFTLVASNVIAGVAALLIIFVTDGMCAGKLLFKRYSVTGITTHSYLFLLSRIRMAQTHSGLLWCFRNVSFFHHCLPVLQ